jgi:hypothetical protein
MVIRSAAARLLALDLPSGLSSPLREALQAERKRWVDQVDEATRYLIDNVERYALSYVPIAGHRDRVLKYAITARMIWISGRSLPRKLELLEQLSEPIVGIYFAYLWQRTLRIVRDIRRFEQIVAQVESQSAEA